MKNKLKDIGGKFLAISVCLIVLCANIFLYTNTISKDKACSFNIGAIQFQNKDITKTKSEKKVNTTKKNNIKITSRGGSIRKPKEYVVYKLFANNKEVLVFEKEEDANKCKKEILDKTERLELEIKKEIQYTLSNVSDEKDIKNVKQNYINKYKKIIKKTNVVKNTTKTSTNTKSTKAVSIKKGYYPTKTKYISSYYGSRSMGWHSGIDLAGRYKDPIYAYQSGKVIAAKYSGNYGNMVLIQHENGMKTRYAHMSSILVKVGENVSGGQKIGLMGSTGRSTGNHLHFEVIINGKNVNPYGYIF